MGAILSDRWLVKASSRAEAQAARAAHQSLMPMVGAGSVATDGSPGPAATSPLLVFQASVPHSRANRVKPEDQASACQCADSSGSTSSG